VALRPRLSTGLPLTIASPTLRWGVTRWLPARTRATERWSLVFSQIDRCRDIHHPLRHRLSMPVLVRSSGAIFSLSRLLTHRRGTQRLDAGWSIARCDGSSILSSIGGNVAVGRRSDKPKRNIAEVEGDERHILFGVVGALAGFAPRADRALLAIFIGSGELWRAAGSVLFGTGRRADPFDADGYFLRPRCAPD
jgi:hypothetical protein